MAILFLAHEPHMETAIQNHEILKQDTYCARVHSKSPLRDISPTRQIHSPRK